MFNISFTLKHHSSLEPLRALAIFFCVFTAFQGLQLWSARIGYSPSPQFPTYTSGLIINVQIALQQTPHKARFPHRHLLLGVQPQRFPHFKKTSVLYFLIPWSNSIRVYLNTFHQVWQSSRGFLLIGKPQDVDCICAISNCARLVPHSQVMVHQHLRYWPASPSSRRAEVRIMKYCVDTVYTIMQSRSLHSLFLASAE